MNRYYLIVTQEVIFLMVCLAMNNAGLPHNQIYLKMLTVYYDVQISYSKRFDKN